MSGGGDGHQIGRGGAARVAAGAGVLGRRAAPAPTWPGGPALLAAFAGRISADARAEAESGRLVLWLPAAFALGIVLYFAADQEPVLPVVALLVAGLAGAAVRARRRAVAFGILLGLLAVATGFLAGGTRTALVAHPIAVPPEFAVRLTGHVERVERRPAGDRILLRLDGTPVRGLPAAPELVRLTLRRGTAPPVGSRITQLARLLPPPAPAMPGGHDFGRGIWFRGIGATGYGLGRPQLEPAVAAPFPVTVARAVEWVRARLSQRIHAAIGGTDAAIAVALVAGDRSGIPEAVEESMRVSGLTHILSISGLHMALVAGTLFWALRALLAALPGLALRWPIKSVAAAVALAGSAAYLVLSGNDVPAQRSFVMTALVLAGVLAGRQALTLRTVAVAAVVVLAAAPEAALEAGTQMSFAATLGLVAAYERLRGLRVHPRPDGLALRILLVPLLFFGGLALTSLVAGLASGPFGAFHFQRVAPYGLLANLLAMPAVSLVVMPFGLVGVLLIPFGWDAIAWPVMGQGIAFMVAVSDRIAALPGADASLHWINAACLAWLSLALLCLCLLRGMLASVAVVPFCAALLAAGPPGRPDVLVSADAAAVAVRAGDGRLSILGARSRRLVAAQWLTREGDTRTVAARDLSAAFACDRSGCVAPLPGGGTLAVSRRADALEADCLTAQIVVTRQAPPAGCPALLLTPASLARGGTLALYRNATGWRAQWTRPEGRDRPWMPQRPPPPPPDGEAGWSADAAAADAEGD